MEKLQEVLEKWDKIPLVSETGPASGANSELMCSIRRKRRIQYALLCLIGIIPWFLSVIFGMDLNPGMINMFLGFVIPGGGFFAHVSLFGALAGMAILVAFFTIGRSVIEWYGNIALMAFLWAGGALGGLFSKRMPDPWSLTAVVIPATLCFSYFEWKQLRLEKRILKDRTGREERFDKIVRRVENLPQKEEETYRELDDNALKAARYLFDMTVREKGDFRDYNKTSINSMGAYRYQFSALGYALMLMQCKYTPNFHGYQSKAWRFLIEAFTDPRCCAYWKWEYLGGRLKWNPDPVANENIMLSGWMLPVVNGYGANTGDRRFEKENAVRFHPFYRENTREYGYSAGELTRLLVDQWRDRKYPGILISCEPHIAFPICNSYGILGGMIYDRDHGTDYMAEILDMLNEAVRRDFVEADGCVADMRHYLFGASRFMHKPAMNVSPIGGISIAMQYRLIDPGLAKRCYGILRDEVIEIKNGMAYLRGMPWEEAVDLGTMTKNPSMYCGLLEQLAAEYGDRELLQAMEAVERHYLKASKNPEVLRYKGVAVINMAYLALSKWAKQGDWYDVIHKGPGENALKGPVLEECSYPDVLVARAVSTDGTDLELVLRGGSSRKEQEIRIGRLQPGQVYLIEGMGRRIRADESGRANFQVNLEKRLKIRIRRA